ncbi:MAG: ATP-binding cassette domain-containing protein [Chitinophagales bacterium]
MKEILVLESVNKTYGDYKANDAISFSVPANTIFGLLGPNGAGKTTLIRIITNILKADSGKIYIDGELLKLKHREVIGYMPEERGLYRQMRVGEHLMYLAQLKGLSKKVARQKIDEWLEKFGVVDWWNKKIEELSKGMQQKIQFIATVIHEPKLLILDEPFSGLDPVNANLIKKEIYELKSKGTSIIFSTHNMESVEEICEEIVLINQGKNILSGKVAEIKQRYKQNRFEIEYYGALPDTITKNYNIVEQQEQSLILQAEENISSTNALLKDLLASGIEIKSFNEVLPRINEIFIREVSK